jgi:7,8-dihydroneopterin 2',3'-cyclic phosphate phosphodiesterase
MVADLGDEITRLAELIKNNSLRASVLELLCNPTLSYEAPHLAFDECPGGSYQHHSYRGGLRQHTIAVTRIALTLCDLVEEVYGGEVDRDTVVAGALIHDVYKCYAYEARGDSYASSEFGDKVDHLSLIVAELYRRGFPLEVIHVVAAHHGENGPIQPKTLEALIVHQSDLTDSEFSRKTLRAAEYLLRQLGDPRPRLESSAQALEVVRVKASEGWQGLVEHQKDASRRNRN